VARAKLPFDAASRTVIERATAIVRERRLDYVYAVPVLQALIEDESGPIATLIASVGTNLERLRTELARA
jgi:ATP-dependent Clp protease ATP-binding subunit ClpA